MKKSPFLNFEEMLPVLRSLLAMGGGSLEDTLNLEHLNDPAEQELRSHIISKFIEMRMGPEMPSQDALVEAILSCGVKRQSHTVRELAKAIADGERISVLRDSSDSGNSDVMIGIPSRCEIDVLYNFGIEELPEKWSIEDITEELIEEGWLNEEEESEKSKAIAYVKRYAPEYRHDAGHPAQFFANTLYVPEPSEESASPTKEILLAMTFEGTGYSYSNWIMKRDYMESILTDALEAMPQFFSHDGKMYFDDVFIYPPLFQNDVYKFKDGSRASDSPCVRYSISSALFPPALKEALLEHIIDQRYDGIYYAPSQFSGKNSEIQRLSPSIFRQAPLDFEIEEIYTKLGKEMCAGLRLFEISWYGYSSDSTIRYDEDNLIRALFFCYPEDRPSQRLGRGGRIEAGVLTKRGKESLTFISNHLLGEDALVDDFEDEVFHFMNDPRIYDITEKVLRIVFEKLQGTR